MFLSDNSVFIPVENPNKDPQRTANNRLAMERRLTTFDEIEAVYTEEQALNEAARCLKCPTHWCQKSCPAGVPVTDFIARIRQKDYEGAYRLIRTASTLPEFCSRVCPQEKQCQSNCTRSIRSMTVGIGRLERFVVERHYNSGGEAPAPVPTGKRVAVVGSGPSGLSAAQRLADHGHSVTVYEKNDRPGGLLEYGIPNTKLEKGVLARKIAAMEAQGVTFRACVNVGVDISADQLIQDYDAVLLTVGTGNARTLKLEGSEGVTGIYPAVEFLTSVTKSLLDSGLTDGKSISVQAKDVIIVGGGDTGSDCVGTSLRGHCASVTQIEMLPKVVGREIIRSPYVQPEKEKKVDPSMEECQAVFQKDPHLYQTTVKAVQADETGNLKSVTAVALQPVYDDHFRLTMEEIPGSEQTIPCQILIVAAGFLGPQSYVAEAFGVNTSPRSNICTDGYATSTPKVFACGDCRTGQSLVVKAMVDGRDCADAVNVFLTK
ncbi:MAG: glutamate synthase subunit beta [Oscillospiraceae bacterium]|nr:glutamate synthase subunit beta [Oscillospiraceae bacterium]